MQSEQKLLTKELMPNQSILERIEGARDSFNAWFKCFQNIAILAGLLWAAHALFPLPFIITLAAITVSFLVYCAGRLRERQLVSRWNPLNQVASKLAAQSLSGNFQLQKLALASRLHYQEITPDTSHQAINREKADEKSNFH